jgi:hypothetical protein
MIKISRASSVVFLMNQYYQKMLGVADEVAVVGRRGALPCRNILLDLSLDEPSHQLPVPIKSVDVFTGFARFGIDQLLL